MTNNENNKITCGVIRVDLVKPNPNLPISNSNRGYGMSYSVKSENIAYTIELIKLTFEELGLECPRIYLSGFNLLTKDFIWDNERIVRSIINETNKIRVAGQDTQSGLYTHLFRK